MTVDPTRSTVVAWYDGLPAGLARLVARLQATAATALGDAFTPRDPGQVHATLIGLERAAAPFAPRPLAAHLDAALTPPLTIRFGGVARTDRRMLSRGLPLHDRAFSVGDGGAVLMGWPVVDGVPRPVLAEIRQSCAPLGVTHRYGADPDAYLVVGDVTAALPEACAAVEATVRAELAAAPVQVALSAADLHLVTYDDPALPRASTTWRPLGTREW